jgi:hypothetical protein
MTRLECFVTVLALGTLNLLGGEASGAEQLQSSARPGLVFVVDGVGGLDYLGETVRWAFSSAGIATEARDFVWTHRWGHWLQDLQDFRHLLRKAKDLADEIREAKAEDPDRPIYLLGKSGGTGLVLATAEQLPPNTIERIVLLSAAVSPTYDLRGAFRATRKEIVSFYSPYDQFILGWGTSQFGTVDRYYCASAGLKGFQVPESLSAPDRALYDRLVQVPWSWRMFWQGNPGVHFGSSMPVFLTREVVPWLKP